MAEWADQIRLDGNNATHEGPYSEEEARSMQASTKLLLMYLFILPGMLQKARGDSKTAHP